MTKKKVNYKYLADFWFAILRDPKCSDKRKMEASNSLYGYFKDKDNDA